MKNKFRFARCRISLFAVLYLFIITNPLHAQWIQTGLDGFYVRTITSTGSYLFVGTSGDGMFRSTNNGASWTSINNGLIGLEFPAFAVSGTNLYAGSEGEGVFLSTNNGTSWSATGTLTNPYVLLLLSPALIFLPEPMATEFFVPPITAQTGLLRASD